MRILVGLTLVLVFDFALTMSLTSVDDNAPVVRTHSGSIRGIWQVSQRGRQFQAYKGIPYAQPPIGELRFKPPQPIDAWVDEFAATKLASKCMQFAHTYDDPADRVSGSEDCLYLNVYTPVKQKLPSQQLLPVIVYIHSGAFQFGGGSQNPHFLMDKDVVFVSFNYRLGPLGFLSTGDAVVPGNMGLKDQSLALRWVAENIEVFGGDPKQVTLIGLSAGAASVHYHYLSPMSRGLFHRGMSISGTALDCWTQTEESSVKAKKLGTLIGCPTSSSEELVRCLRSGSAKKILALTGDFMGWLYNPFTPFGPVVETHSDAPFMNKPPIEVINSGEAADLPWITSVVSEEGLYPAAEFIANKELMRELDENWESLAPHLLDYNYTIPKSEHARVARQVRKHYLGDEPIGRETATALIHMIGDRLYVIDGEKAAISQARVSKSPVRFYYFSYRGEFSLSEKFTKTKEDFGVSHADDDAYVFYDPLRNRTLEGDLKMSEDMVNLWTSYASTGIPDVGIEWPFVDPAKERFGFLHIKGPDQFRIESNTNLGEKTFWSAIGFNENEVNGNSPVMRN